MFRLDKQTIRYSGKFYKQFKTSTPTSTQNMETNTPSTPCSPINPTVPQPLPQEEEGYSLRSGIKYKPVPKKVRHAKTKEHTAAFESLQKENDKKAKRILGKNVNKSA